MDDSSHILLGLVCMEISSGLRPIDINHTSRDMIYFLWEWFLTTVKVVADQNLTSSRCFFQHGFFIRTIPIKDERGVGVR